MFERFTELAREVVVIAEREARALGHAGVGAEHLLVALFRAEEGVAARVLAPYELSATDVRARIGGGGEWPEGAETAETRLPFAAGGKKVLQLALREALSLGHNSVGTEHLLLGVVHAGDARTAPILREAGADPEAVRDEVVRLLSRPGRRAEPLPVPPDPPELTSPPLSPEVATELERVRSEKENAIEAQEFERAAAARDRERRLGAAAHQLVRTWHEDVEPGPLPEAPAELLAALSRMPPPRPLPLGLAVVLVATGVALGLLAARLL
ncbi:MAG: UvrB/UvrC motif-containing protein [Thermoleophilia bacterium]|nr:UvrB/UvrC motif-containing protein [Thermoleophilia bacterium]